jgi:hypothetical protein
MMCHSANAHANRVATESHVANLTPEELKVFRARKAEAARATKAAPAKAAPAKAPADAKPRLRSGSSGNTAAA